MLSFKTNLEVLSDASTAESITIGPYDYKVFKVKVANLEMLALFSVLSIPEKGDCIYSNDTYLTHYVDKNGIDSICLRVKLWDKVPKKKFKHDKHLIVRVNGRILKSKDKPLRLVGATSKPFIACTLKILDEVKQPFNLLTIGLYKHAHQLDAVENFSFVDLTAKLFEQTKDTGYELNVQDIKLAQEKKYKAEEA